MLQSQCHSTLIPTLGLASNKLFTRSHKQHSRRHRHHRPAAVSKNETTEAKTPDESQSRDSNEESIADGMEKIYIGKGRYVVDNPKKYPGKEDGWSWFPGVSGGWAGGEVGLQEFTKNAVEETPAPAESAPESDQEESDKMVKTKYDGKDVLASKTGSGNDVLYVGFSARSQEDTKARKSGTMGKFVLDDAKKYPNKEGFGVFVGLTGGFAGGEKGVQQFAEKGDIEFIDPSLRRRQWSPLVVAIIVAGVGSIGTILLTDVFDISEDLLHPDVLNVTLDPSTKLLLEAAIGFLGLAWFGSATFALIKTLRERFSQGAGKIAVGAGFWMIVLFLAYQITQS